MSIYQLFFREMRRHLLYIFLKWRDDGKAHHLCLKHWSTSKVITFIIQAEVIE